MSQYAEEVDAAIRASFVAAVPFDFVCGTLHKADWVTKVQPFDLPYGPDPDHALVTMQGGRKFVITVDECLCSDVDRGWITVEDSDPETGPMASDIRRYPCPCNPLELEDPDEKAWYLAQEVDPEYAILVKKEMGELSVIAAHEALTALGHSNLRAAQIIEDGW